MIYYDDGIILIRTLVPDDAQILAEEEQLQGDHVTREKYDMRLQDRADGKAVALAAEYQGQTAGYISIYPDSDRGAFAGKGLPELVDFGVLKKYRNHGIGSLLMDTAEQIAAGFADTVYLRVGLHSGYGSAQRMYIKRGYIPDGSGVWYGDHICEPYTDCCNDDDLILYLSKKL